MDCCAKENKVSMCDVATRLENIGIQKGLAEGVQKGLAEGELKRLIKQTCKKCRNLFLLKRLQMTLLRMILRLFRRSWMQPKNLHRNMI